MPSEIHIVQTIREKTEQREHQSLSRYATFADESKGREREESHAISVPPFSVTGIGLYMPSRSAG